MEEQTGNAAIHLDGSPTRDEAGKRYVTCGEERVGGIICTGDPNQVTCSKCKKGVK
jgi:hypothetical protein